MLNAALYYPYIRIPDGSWLRTSLLLWDQIGAIVPDSAEPEPWHVSHELREKGLVKFVDPMDHYPVLSSHAFADGFKRLLRKRPVASYLEGEAGLTVRLHKTSFGPNLNDKNEGIIHTNKISEGVLEMIPKRYGSRRYGDWIEVDPRLADVYMAYLTRTIAKTWSAAPLTHSDQLNSLLLALEEPKVGRGSGPSMSSIQTEIQAKIPVLPPDFPVSEILRIKDKYSHSYRRFRLAVVNLRAGLDQNAGGEFERQRLLEEFRYALDSSLEQLEKMARREQLDLLHASLRTMFSVTGVSAGLLAATDPTMMVGPALGGAAVAYKFGEELRTRRLEREDRIERNTFSYLFQLKKEVNG